MPVCCPTMKWANCTAVVMSYCTGVVSSRKMERATREDVPFRYLSADTHPDHDTISAFRKRHLEALAGLFVQALRLCQKAGLVKLGHVAIAGTKIKASVSKHWGEDWSRAVCLRLCPSMGTIGHSTAQTSLATY